VRGRQASQLRQAARVRPSIAEFFRTAVLSQRGPCPEARITPAPKNSGRLPGTNNGARSASRDRRVAAPWVRQAARWSRPAVLCRLLPHPGADRQKSQEQRLIQALFLAFSTIPALRIASPGRLRQMRAPVVAV
jgi:hypothetical protein